jgi:hypothetical protein
MSIVPLFHDEEDDTELLATVLIGFPNMKALPIVCLRVSV